MHGPKLLLALAAASYATLGAARPPANGIDGLSRRLGQLCRPIGGPVRVAVVPWDTGRRFDAASRRCLLPCSSSRSPVVGLRTPKRAAAADRVRSPRRRSCGIVGEHGAVADALDRSVREHGASIVQRQPLQRRCSGSRGAAAGTRGPRAGFRGIAIRHR